MLTGTRSGGGEPYLSEDVAPPMPRLIIALILTLMVGCSGGPPSDSSIHVLNQETPGARLELSPQLVPEQTNIVYFHADWCPECRTLGPRLEELAKKREMVVLLKVDIKSWESEVAEQFSISRLPHLQLYDGEGKLLSAGAKALKQVEKLLAQSLD